MTLHVVEMHLAGFCMLVAVLQQCVGFGGKMCPGSSHLNLEWCAVQEGDDEDLPPLEEDVDEGSRMEVSRIHARMIFLWACRQRGT